MTAVIFDVDGTLVDSVDFHTRAWQEALAQFGHSIPFQDIRSQIGKGGDQLLPVFLSRDELEAQGEALEKCRGDIFKEKYLHQVEAFPQVRTLFLRMRKDGWKIALASSAKKDELQTYKKVSGIADLLDTETSTDDAEKSKPHPDIFEAALKRLGDVPPEECVVVGDSPYDAEAATKAGIQSVAFLCGGFPEKTLWESGYRVLYRDAADLLENYEQSLFHLERPRSD